MTPHLTEEQFAELLAAPRSADPANAAAQAHLAECPSCAAELAGVQDSLALFREASTALAEAHLREVPRPALPVRRPVLLPYPAYWAAAAAMLFAAFIPIERMRERSTAPKPPVLAQAPATHSAESDEALLDDVNREISESVPTPMQALADPATATLMQNSDQRKE